MPKTLVPLLCLTLLAGCLSQTVSEEGGWDPGRRVRVNGLYQSVTVVQSTGDTERTVRVFRRFRNDGTFWVGVSQFMPPMYPDSVVSSDTTSRFFLWWEQRGSFELTSDSIRYFHLQQRISDYNDVFPDWKTDSVTGRSENIAKKYRLFTSDTWITHWSATVGSSMGGPSGLGLQRHEADRRREHGDSLGRAQAMMDAGCAKAAMSHAHPAFNLERFTLCCCRMSEKRILYLT